MKPIERNGWKIYFYPLFNRQWQELVDRVKALREKLEIKKFSSHTDVKLLKALDTCIKEKIPTDPFAYYFTLTHELKKYSRVKKMGLPSRYRLFFRAFKESKTIIILWLGFPRREGDRNDCYSVFSTLVARGEFPEDLTTLLELLSQEEIKK